MVTDRRGLRFEREAEAFGRLQQPGIAQSYSAGTRETGQSVLAYDAPQRWMIH